MFVSGYSGWTGEAFDDWISGSNDIFLSGAYRDITGLDGRVLAIELDSINYINTTTMSDFSSTQAAFRDQINLRLSQLEDDMRKIKAALASIRSQI